MTVAQVAEVVGFSAPYLRDIERGRRNCWALSPEAVGLLEEAMGAPSGSIAGLVAEAFRGSSPWGRWGVGDVG